MSKSVINEEFLQQVERLQMLVKNNVAGMFGGNHKSKNFGSSCEFADMRDYIPGDDTSKIDWKIFARTDNLFTRRYLDERQMHTKIYIDASRSMSFGNGKKDEQALKISAVIAYLSVCEMDKVSIFAIRENQFEDIVKGVLGKDAYTTSINGLNSVEFYGDSRISDCIIPSSVGYGDGMSVIISDFLTDNDYEKAIDYLISKKRHVLCVQVLSKDELKPMIRGKMHLYDSENSDNFFRKNINRDIIDAYKKALDFVTSRVRDFCAVRGADYMLVSAEDNLAEVFFNKLVGMGVLK